MIPQPSALYLTCERTWPPARCWTEAGVTYRDGQGGGKRVSAATVDGAPDRLMIEAAETAMRVLNQSPLFMIRDGDAALDKMLSASGYQVVDPVQLYVMPLDRLVDVPIPPVTAFAAWEPLAIMVEIWEQGGIGPARLAVMERAANKTGIFARWQDKPAGVAFAALHDDICMVHAVEVLPEQRRNGVAQWIMRKAAFWAAEQGARWMSVLCVKENIAANRLYQGLGFQPAGTYHYRIKEAT